MTVDEAKKEILAMDDGEWSEAFDSTCQHNYLDTLSNVQNNIPCADWKVFALLDYMQRAEGQRP